MQEKSAEPALLATKLQIPPGPQQLVHRSRLLGRLNDAIPRCKLTLISAPAGYGKTSLLSHWARLSGLTVVWLSIDEGENRSERFWRYLLAGWEKIQPGLGESPLGIFLDSQLPDQKILLTTLINYANTLADDLVFVLDDYNLIENKNVHQMMTFLLDHLPPSLHFVLLCREEPTLPLARYRARQELFELHARDLAFLEGETADFLTGIMGLKLEEGQIRALHRQLEGWAAGLQMVALSRDLGGIPAGSVSGRHRFIADYLSQEILARQPESRQLFLLQTSILEKLSDALCNALTGRRDGQERLNKLTKDNLFLGALDENREWFRYHPLFADFLRERLARRYPEEINSLHSRAAGWYFAQDLPNQAFRHALLGGNAGLVAQLLERHFPAKLLTGELTELSAWLAALPVEWQFEHPIIGLAQAGVLLFSGQLDACAVQLDKVEKLTVDDGKRFQENHARITALRCSIACFENDLPRARALADEALRDLPAGDLSFQPIVYGALGDTYRRNDRWQEARDCYLSLLNFSIAPAFQVQSVHIYGALADLSLRQGQLRDAGAYWEKALRAIQKRENWGTVSLPFMGWVYLRFGELLYEWNRLPEATKYLSDSLERVELGGDVRGLIAGYLLAGRLALAEGDLEHAADYLEKTRPLTTKAQFPIWVNQIERLEVELWLAGGQGKKALRWVEAALEKGKGGADNHQLSIIRVLVAKEDVSARTFAALEALIQSAEAAGKLGIEIQALSLQALAHWQRSNPAKAMVSLEQALQKAEPEGYIRLFTDLGRPMARLLQEARGRSVLPDYVARLLASFRIDLEISGAIDLPEPLTSREQEALTLLAGGLTNQEIAEEMVISPETVKKHLSHIYSKLGVHDRRQAVKKARALSLLT